ncbi:MAG: cadherin-like domain-containing protein [Candidatus Omnitrophica bacterium]|nr:cadherin-like domain-containing protein [Candidatus Omnitrophota bacterium]
MKMLRSKPLAWLLLFTFFCQQSVFSPYAAYANGQAAPISATNELGVPVPVIPFDPTKPPSTDDGDAFEEEIRTTTEELQDDYPLTEAEEAKKQETERKEAEKQEAEKEEKLNYEYERYEFEDAVDLLRPEFATAVIVKDLSKENLETLTKLDIEVGVAVLHGEIVLFTSGSENELGTLPAVKALIDKASFMSHTHPGEDALQGPSHFDIQESVEAPKLEWVVSHEDAYAYNQDGVANGGKAFSHEDYLEALSRALWETAAERDQMAARGALNLFVAEQDRYNEAPESEQVTLREAGDLIINAGQIVVLASGETNFGDITILGDGQLISDHDIRVSGRVSVSGTGKLMINGTVVVEGNVTLREEGILEAKDASGKAILKFFGEREQIFDLTGAADNLKADVFISKPIQSVILASDAIFSGTFEVTTGTFDANGKNVTVAGRTNVFNGNYKASSGTQTFNGGLIQSGTGDFMGGTGDVVITESLTVAGDRFEAPTGTLTINGDFEVTSAGKFFGSTGGVDLNGNFKAVAPGVFVPPSGVFSVSGNWRSLGTISSLAVTFDGSGVQTLDATNPFSKITHSGSGTLRLVNSDLTVTNRFENTSGVFDLNGRGWAMTGAAFSNDGTLRLQGEENIVGLVQDTDSGTWEYVSDRFVSLKDFGIVDYFNLVLGSPGGTGNYSSVDEKRINGTLTITGGSYDTNARNTIVAGLATISGGRFDSIGGTQVFNGGLTISGAGIFEADTATIDLNGNLHLLSGGSLVGSGGGKLNISGNWNNAGGTFIHNGETVTFDGANQRISGSNTFKILKKVSTVSDTLTFEAGSTQTIVGKLTLKGADANNLLSLRSTVSGTQFKIDPQSTRDIAFLDIKDSNNINPTIIDCSSNCVDSGNNVGWLFDTRAQEAQDLITTIRTMVTSAETQLETVRAAHEAEDLTSVGNALVALNTILESAQSAQAALQEARFDGLSGIDLLRNEADQAVADIQSIITESTLLRDELETRLNDIEGFIQTVRMALAEAQAEIVTLRDAHEAEDLPQVTTSLNLLTANLTSAQSARDSLNDSRFDATAGIDLLREEAEEAVTSIQALVAEGTALKTELETRNHVPTASLQSVSVNEDNDLEIILGGTDPENDTLTFEILEGPDPEEGELLNFNPAQGTLTFRPAQNFNGSLTFTFRVSDGELVSDEAEVSITVNSVNDAPTATVQSVSVNEDNDLTIQLTGSDVEGDTLTFNLVSGSETDCLSGGSPGGLPSHGQF